MYNSGKYSQPPSMCDIYMRPSCVCVCAGKHLYILTRPATRDLCVCSQYMQVHYESNLCASIFLFIYFFIIDVIIIILSDTSIRAML